MKLKQFAGIACLIAALIPLSSSAQTEPTTYQGRLITYQGDSVFRDKNNTLYFVRLGFNPQSTLKLLDIEVKRSAKVDACGVLSFSSTVTPRGIKLNDVPYTGTTVVSAPSPKPWKCRISQGVGTLEAVDPTKPLTPQTTPSADKQIKIGDKYFLFAPNLAGVSVAVIRLGTYERKVGGVPVCGYQTVKSSSTVALTNTTRFQWDSQPEQTVGNLKQVPIAPICNSNGPFVPPTWEY